MQSRHREEGPWVCKLRKHASRAGREREQKAASQEPARGRPGAAFPGPPRRGSPPWGALGAGWPTEKSRVAGAEGAECSKAVSGSPAAGWLPFTCSSRNSGCGQREEKAVSPLSRSFEFGHHEAVFNDQLCDRPVLKKTSEKHLFGKECELFRGLGASQTLTGTRIP